GTHSITSPADHRPNRVGNFTSTLLGKLRPTLTSASRTAAGAVERGVEEHLDGLVLALRVVGGGDRARVAEQRSHVADVGSGVQTLVGERLVWPARARAL
ncbi:hypothetical protein, partial [Burkholderia glumae]|uniref:hypothetical protein n=1 Tax=Burkholderia glumae TaxID=337 RepID=UPI001FC835A0